MAVTASRLGSSPLTFDWSNLLWKAEHDSERCKAAWAKLKSRFHSSDVGFFDAPIQNDLSQAEESIRMAEKMKANPQITDCLFLGIGGSALGPISLLSSLQDKATHKIKFHFVENPDPWEWRKTLASLNPDRTLVCSVTKSGTTFETMAQTLLALEWLGKSSWNQQFLAITDPVQGDLRKFVATEGLPSLKIAPSMGGRFSIFTPVGLFAAALSGHSVEQFLLGAKQVRDYVEKAPLEKNPLIIIGEELIRQYPKRTVHVCMPYATRLRLFGDWFVQIWGESLGKDGKGFTPIGAVGATDQHSILQLLRDGPDDKITFFISIDQAENEVSIPKMSFGSHHTPYPSFKILEGHSLYELLSIEQRATSLVLTKQRRPHITVRLDKLDERNLGALYFSYSVLTAFTGALWGVNPFDQPGVEEGKVYIRQALNQEVLQPEENTAVERLRRHREFPETLS